MSTPKTGRRGRRVALLIGVLVVVLAAGLVLRARPGDTPRLRPKVPGVLYLEHRPGAESALDLTPALVGGWGGSARATVTVDARGLDGVARLGRAYDIGCKVRMPHFRCETTVDPKARLTPGSPHFRVMAVGEPAAGSSGELRYTMSSPKTPTVTGVVTVIVGSPRLTVYQDADRTEVDPGQQVEMSLSIRNTGDVAARGVTIVMAAYDGLTLTPAHRNCVYKDTGAWCRLPKTVVQPGETYRLKVPERLGTRKDATLGTVAYTAMGTDDATLPAHVALPGYHPGKGPDLQLLPVTGKPAGVNDIQQIRVRSRVDLRAVGGTVRGPVGSRAQVRIGFRNNGPGDLRSTDVRVEFRVPAGTTVVESPYDFERDEELFGQDCAAVDARGRALTEEPSVKQPSARRYVCNGRGGKAGDSRTFPFTLHIDRDIGDRGGRVSVLAPRGEPAGDVAAVPVQVWYGPAWATRSFYLTVAVVLALVALSLVVRVRRRRARSTAPEA